MKQVYRITLLLLGFNLSQLFAQEVRNFQKGQMMESVETLKVYKNSVRAISHNYIDVNTLFSVGDFELYYVEGKVSRLNEDLELLDFIEFRDQVFPKDSIFYLIREFRLSGSGLFSYRTWT